MPKGTAITFRDELLKRGFGGWHPLRSRERVGLLRSGRLLDLPEVVMLRVSVLPRVKTYISGKIDDVISDVKAKHQRLTFRVRNVVKQAFGSLERRLRIYPRPLSPSAIRPNSSLGRRRPIFTPPTPSGI